jgi:hypothetical protein
MGAHDRNIPAPQDKATGCRECAAEQARKKARYRLDSGLGCCGAGEMIRTPDLLITNELLYRLSYTGNFWKQRL